MNSIQNIANMVENIKTYLNSLHMLAYTSWISGCAEYFVNEGFTLQEIKENAYNQWLLNDLRYICPGSLPENLTEQEKTVLNGPFVLQINSVLDISVPAYQQYLKIKKTDIENIKATMNAEEKISSKRMLKFELTDGKQTIAGMEYETISKVKAEDIVPGHKLRITGPVQCRKGMLLLTNSVVEFLGGEVQDMLQTHSLAAQLALKLNLPMIANDSSESTQITNAVNRSIPDQTAQNTGLPTYPINRQIPQSYQSTSHVNNCRSENAFAKRQVEVEGAPQKKLKLDEAAAIDDVDLIELEEDDLLAIEECERLHCANGPVTLSNEPFVYIKQINDLSESQKRGKVFRVKAQIQNVITKLTMTANRQWSLKCTIVDGSGCMDVEFSSEILSNFLGYTPEDISELKKKVANNPEIKNNINAAYAKTAKSLKTLYCIMELTMHVLPKITRLIEFDDSHIDLLKKRLKAWT